MKSLKQLTFLLALLAVLSCGAVESALAQDKEDAPGGADCSVPKDYGMTVPLWSYKVKSDRGDKGMYGGEDGSVVVGKACPFDKQQNQTPTTVMTHRVWVTVTIDEGGTKTVFDPLETNSCATDADNKPHSVFEIVARSPLFRDYGKAEGYTNLGNDNVLQGISDEKTQYGDFSQRANFWTVIDDASGTPGGSSAYRVKLDPIDDILESIEVTNGDGKTRLFKQDCQKKRSGWILERTWKANLQTLWTDLVNNKNVKPTDFTIFLVDTVQLCPNPDTAGQWEPSRTACIPGYHSSQTSGNGDNKITRTFAFADFDSVLRDDKGKMSIDGDVSTLSHEIGEWMNNPIVGGDDGDWFKKGSKSGNPTPKWWGGQVPWGECQSNMEVGDPLSQPTIDAKKKVVFTPKPWTIKIKKPAQPFNYEYHLQELAYFSWFFAKPSVGAGEIRRAAPHWFSNHGTFMTEAAEPPNDCKDAGVGK